MMQGAAEMNNNFIYFPESWYSEQKLCGTLEMAFCCVQEDGNGLSAP